MKLRLICGVFFGFLIALSGCASVDFGGAYASQTNNLEVNGRYLELEDSTVYGIHIGSGGKYTKSIFGYFSGQDAISEQEVGWMSYGLFLKIPINIWRFTLYPMGGADYVWRLTGDDPYIYKDQSDFMSNLWFKIGGGLEFAFTESFFINGEFLYGRRSNSELEKNYNSNFLSDAGNMNIMIGLGYYIDKRTMPPPRPKRAPSPRVTQPVVQPVQSVQPAQPAQAAPGPSQQVTPVPSDPNISDQTGSTEIIITIDSNKTYRRFFRSDSDAHVYLMTVPQGCNSVIISTSGTLNPSLAVITGTAKRDLQQNRTMPRPSDIIRITSNNNKVAVASPADRVLCILVEETTGKIGDYALTCTTIVGF